ncbi:MAG: 16S rRNA (uracil(1498)-N(3))-methyltransferase [Gemmatimonadaceae bacterium]
MERNDQTSLATFMVSGHIVAGRTIALGEGEARHVLVRRIAVGQRVRLTNGVGGVGSGTLVRLTKTQACVDVDTSQDVAQGDDIHLMVPVADRDRMLWLAEKATELGITSWRPVVWRRSKSVSPRGEGLGFQDKVRGRMTAALTQSGHAWMPTLFPDASLERALAAVPSGSRYVLDPEGASLLLHPITAPLTIAVGPEGGVEESELRLLMESDFIPVSLARQTLRFETAAIVAVGAVQAALTARKTKGNPNG